MSPDSLRRKFSLQGEDAQQWLAERDFFGEFDTTFRLVSDEIRFEGFGAARVWHSEGSYEIARRSPTALLIVQIEGESTLQVPTWGEASRVISPGDVAVLPGGGGGGTIPVCCYPPGREIPDRVRSGRTSCPGTPRT